MELIKNIKSLVLFLSLGTIFGVVIALSLPKKYTSEVLLAPEMSAGGLGLSENIADMASSFGIDLSSAGKNIDAIYPEIYPEILSSYDFVSTLFPVKVRLKDNNNLRTYYDHILKEQKIPFWDYPMIWLNQKFSAKDSKSANVQNINRDNFRVSKTDLGVSKIIEDNVSCLIDKKSSIILISVSDQDPMVAAIIADTIQSRLQYYITDYKTKKAQKDVAYYAKLYKEAKVEYNRRQRIYASYCDTNQDVVLESFQAKRDELENDMQISFNIMNQMENQLQAARAKVQARTPSFTVIKSPKMSLQASSMSRLSKVLLVIFISFVLNAIWVLVLRKFIKR